MKKTLITILTSLILITTIFFMVGCSDMMAKLGNISLTIDLDTPEVEVSSYALEGTLTDSNSRFTLNNIVPPRHTLSELKEGRWNLTVKAFDDQGNQIGVGTKTVDLKAGQVVETSLLVEFGQSTPVLSTFTIAGPSRHDDREGSVAGTTTRMEYRLASAAADDPFTACTAGTTQLVPGEYHIRLAQAHGLQASESLTVTIPTYQKIQLTIAAPTLTTTKEYDGTDTVQGSITPGEPSGVRSGDDVAVHAQASYDSASVGNSKNITVVYSLSGADALNYTKPADTIVATGVINQKQLSISGTTVTTSKVYDGSTSATVTNHGTPDGKVGTEAVTVTATASYQDKHAGTGKLISVSYTLGGTHADNYLAPANTSFSGTITKSSLTVTYTTTPQPTKVYDGTATAQIATTGSLVGVVTGDRVELLTTATYDDHDADSSKSGTISYALSGTDANNYTAPANGTFSSGTITARPLTVTGYNLTASKPYDGNTNASIGSVTFNGKIPADEVQVSATAAYDSAAVSSEDLDKTITITYRVSGLDAVNYLEPVSSTALGTIVQKQLTVSETDIASTKVYDGSTLATVESHGTLDGKVDGEVVTVTAHPVYQDRHAGTGKLINVSYTLGGTNAGNYRAPANANFVGEITPKALGVSGTSVQLSKVYDGSTTAVVTASGSPSNLVSGDAVTVHAQASYDTADANEGKTLTVTYSISGANAKNYTAPAPSTYGSTGTITKRQLTATGYNLTASKPYDGNANASIDSVTFSGNIFGDDIQVASTAAYDSAALGTNKPITVSYSLSGDDSPNYLKPADSIATVAGEIAKKQLTVSGTTVASKDYDGTTSAPIDSHGTLEGVVAGDTVTLSAVATYATKTARSGKEASVVYTLSGADKDKYLAPENGSLTGTINKRLLTATSIAVTGSKEYDGTRNASITACTINNLVAGDTVTVQKTATYDTKLAGTDKTITVSFGLDGTDKDNYIEPDSRVVYSNGIITQKSLTVSGTSYSTTKEYDGTTTIPITSNGTLQGVAVGDVVTLSNVTGFYTSADIGTNKAFTIRYTISGTDAANYTVPDTTGTSGTITKIAMTGDVTITGSAVFGQVLTAVPDLYNTGTPTYQWKRDDAAIIGATNTAYTLVEADIGKKISVTATATGTNYTGSITSEETATVTKAAGSALSDTFEAYYPIVSADQTNITQDIINLTGFTANQTGIEVSISTDGTSYESYSDLVIDSRGRAMISITSAQKVKLRYKATSTHYAGADLLLSVGAKDLAIGDYYAGGVVGYIYQTTDTAVYIANQVHGLIAAKADTSEGIKWSSNITLEIGTAVGIGTGWTNTQAIIDALDGSEVGRYAAKEADSMRDGGYDDWFLPSLNELKKLRDSRVLIGNFSTTWLSRYMSSSESTQKITQYPPKENYHIVYFDRNDDIIEVWTKDAGTHIRAVRYF
jgi:hypothetical protein